MKLPIKKSYGDLTDGGEFYAELADLPVGLAVIGRGAKGYRWLTGYLVIFDETLRDKFGGNIAEDDILVYTHCGWTFHRNYLPAHSLPIKYPKPPVLVVGFDTAHIHCEEWDAKRTYEELERVVIEELLGKGGGKDE